VLRQQSAAVNADPTVQSENIQQGKFSADYLLILPWLVSFAIGVGLLTEFGGNGKRLLPAKPTRLAAANAPIRAKFTVGRCERRSFAAIDL